MKEIWAVSTGSYSDYSVLALFEDEADAQAAVDESNAEDNYLDARVESFYFYPSGTRPHYKKTFYRTANISDEGSIGQIQEWDNSNWDMGLEYDHPKVEIYSVGRSIRLSVFGADLQAVNQAFSDNLAQIKVRIAQTGKAIL